MRFLRSHADSGWFLVGHGADLKEGREGWCPGAMRNGLPPGKGLYSQEQEGCCAGPTAATVHDFRPICMIASFVVCTREIIILYNKDTRTSILSLAKETSNYAFSDCAYGFSCGSRKRACINLANLPSVICHMY